MAFRDDEDALRARSEELQRELEAARSRLGELEGVAVERDRLQREIDALRPKPKPKRQRERPAPAPSAGGARPPVARGPLLVALLALLGVGLIGSILYLGWGVPGVTDSALAPKPPDTRPPSIGVVDLVATPDPAPIAFSVTGTDEAPSGCSGYLPSAPQLVLRTSSPMLATVTTQCGIDLVAVLSSASGVLCDDDGGESNQPLIRTALPTGDARLTIGTYSEDASAQCQIVIHAVPLAADVDAHGLATAGEPQLGTVALNGAEGTEAAFDGTVHAALVAAPDLQSECRGWIGSTPDVVLDIAEPTIARLDTMSQADLVFVMRNPDGTFVCDDDDGMGAQPRIAKRLAPGRYALWVGGYDDDDLAAPFHVGIHLATIASEASLAPTPVDLLDGTPLALRGDTGDELSAPSMWSECTVPGYVRYEPQATIRLAARRDVTITNVGPGSTPLFVVAPHGAIGEPGRVACTTTTPWRTTLDAGTYDLWVGVASGDVLRGAFEAVVATAPPSVLPYTP
jgi:hypothetical protein